MGADRQHRLAHGLGDLLAGTPAQEALDDPLLALGQTEGLAKVGAGHVFLFGRAQG